MSQQKSDPKAKKSTVQPVLTELSPEELDRATGGDKAQTTNKATLSDFHFTKVVDKASP